MTEKTRTQGPDGRDLRRRFDGIWWQFWWDLDRMDRERDDTERPVRHWLASLDDEDLLSLRRAVNRLRALVTSAVCDRMEPDGRDLGSGSEENGQR
jgi:hypothetical protein